jgi:hypothetical protein
MTSFYFDFESHEIKEQIKKWEGTENDLKIIISYRVYDIRKWKLVERMLKKGKLTKFFYESLRNRNYKPPTKKQLILKKYNEVLSLYDEIFFYSSFVSFPEKIDSDFESTLEYVRNKANIFENSYSELLALDPETSIHIALKKFR